MNGNGDDKKLDWMYKGANSLVDREEYLLGRSVDKTLEQLNAEEKEKKLGLVPPKNHVEHECIPPSIRDFNKIVQAEQVDISAKLQEDPLVAIKKREEEARRQFLQNPVQLKKLQEALKAQQLKNKKKCRKSKTSDSDSDLDDKIAKKLKYLKEDPSSLVTPKKQKKKSKDNILDTILMHKFNQLKDRLSQDDLNEILAGESDSDKEKKKKKHKKRKNVNIEESDSEEKKLKRKEKRRGRSTSKEKLQKLKKRASSSDTSDSNEEEKHVIYKKRDNKRYSRSSSRDLSEEKHKSSKPEIENNRRKQSAIRDQNRHKYKDNRNENRRVQGKEHRKEKKDSSSENEHNKIKGRSEQCKKIVNDSDRDLESQILKKLRMLRDSDKSKRKESSSDSDDDKKKRSKKVQKKRKTRSSSSESTSDSDSEDTQSQNKHKNRYDSDSDNDEQIRKPKAFGLVKSDGTKLALGKKPYEVKKPNKSSMSVEAAMKPDRKNIKKLSEEEKEKLRREMMKNAEKRDIERSENLKRYRDEDKKEERDSANYDKDFLRKQLLKSTKDATVETRIKSNLNNIQRSSRHMDSHFSRMK